MKPTISDSVLYIGVDDREIDLFESQYRVPDGVSYNSWVILDDKVAIMDTVDRRAADQWLQNLEEALDGRRPDYLVLSHLEPDHGGCVSLAAERYPDMKLVGNVKTFLMLPRYSSIDLTGRTVTVAEGTSLSLGKHQLTFYMAPMVHWPEVMVSFESDEKLLFSADAFGKFGALDFAGPWLPEARRYYINIVGKYGSQVQSLLKKAAGLDIQKICPLHGPVLEELDPVLQVYDKWSRYEPEERGVALCYCSVYGNTRHAAMLLRQYLEESGEKVEAFDLARCDIAEAVAAAFRYDRLALAATTFDAGLFPAMEDYLAHLKSRNFQKRTVGLIENGSWAPQAAKLMREKLEAMKCVNVLEETVTVSSSVKPQTESALRELAQALVNAGSLNYSQL